MVSEIASAQVRAEIITLVSNVCREKLYVLTPPVAWLLSWIRPAFKTDDNVKKAKISAGQPLDRAAAS